MTLHDVQGMSHEEIAKIMDCNIGTVRSRLVLRAAAVAGVSFRLFKPAMNPNSENFDQLRRLLALKRHEAPPPGYFNSFSSQVISRIKRGEHGQPDSLMERLFGEGSWLHHLWGALEARPAIAGVFGVVVCAILISGVVYSEDTAPSPNGIGLVARETAVPATADDSSPVMPVVALNQAIDRSQVAPGSNSVTPSLNAIFDQAQMQYGLQPATRVKWAVPASLGN